MLVQRSIEVNQIQSEKTLEDLNSPLCLAVSLWVISYVEPSICTRLLLNRFPEGRVEYGVLI